MADNRRKRFMRRVGIMDRIFSQTISTDIKNNPDWMENVK